MLAELDERDQELAATRCANRELVAQLSARQRVEDCWSSQWSSGAGAYGRVRDVAGCWSADSALVRDVAARSASTRSAQIRSVWAGTVGVGYAIARSPVRWAASTPYWSPPQRWWSRVEVEVEVEVEEF